MEIVSSSYLHYYNQYSAPSSVRMVGVFTEIIVRSCNFRYPLFRHICGNDFDYYTENNK